MSRFPRLRSALALRAVLAHPELWWIALVQWRRLVPNRWWMRRPFLPVPDSSYMGFRLVTAYGGSGEGPIRPEDLITYLQWCRNLPR